MSLLGFAGGVEVIIVVAFFLLGYVIYLANRGESQSGNDLAHDGRKNNEPN